MKFNRIVSVDHTKLTSRARKELQEYSREEIKIYTDVPESEEEIIRRIEDAEAVLVSWRTQLGENIIKKCPNLKYIGMACSLYDDESANVAVKYAREKGIVVKGIRDYGDPGVAEFIVSELVRLLHGFGESQWKDMPLELTEQKIGIIGLGVTGQLLAECLLPFGAKLYYFSRSRKPDWEEKGLTYRPLNQLLKEVDIISIHLPKNTRILDQAEFNEFGYGKILINTSLGLPFEIDAFEKWIKGKGNFAIFDGDGKAELSENLQNHPKIICAGKSAGWSVQTRDRLSYKVLQNLKNFLKGPC